MSADLVLQARTVHTLDPDRPTARAVAVTDGVISALDDEAVASIGSGTQVVDLGDGVLLPAFGDGHVHPLWGGIELAWAPIRDCRSVEEIAEAVRRYADDHPDHAWVLGGSYDPSLAPGGLFDAAWLDAVVPDRPVMLEASDHHCAWVNSKALEICGITPDTPDPESSVIAKRADGSVLGTLVEFGAVDLIKRHIPPPTPAERATGLLAAGEHLASAGLTWVQEAAATLEDLETYLAVARDLAVRIDVALWAEPALWQSQMDDFVAARAKAETAGMTARTIKFFADGIIEAGTAALLAPYLDAPHSCGLPVWETAELAAAVTAFDAKGFQCHIHAIGDAGVRAALDAFAHANAVNGPRDRRPVIAHTQLIDYDDLPRFVELGVVANFEPLWHCAEPGLTDLVMPRIGSRSVLHYATGSVLRAGAHMSFGSDWPVSSMRPMDGLAVAVTRQTPDGEPPGGWTPEERVTPAEAFAAYTSGVAYQAFEEDRWGRVTVGRRADLVGLAADPFSTEPATWPTIPVLGTWLGGRRTHG